MALASAAPLPAPADQPSIAELLAARPHLTMHAMDGLLLEAVPLNRIADAVGTPTWVYGAGTMRARYRALAQALTRAGLDAQLHYAMKANDHLAVIRLFGAEGAGADVVSEGELRRARAAGIAPAHIVFSGVGKSERDLRFALEQDIGQINVESAEELDMLSELAAGMGRVPPASPCGSTRTWTPRPTPRSPPAARGQIRHPLGRCRCSVCARCGTARYRTGRAGHAYRQPDPVAGAVPRRLCPHRSAGHRPARRRLAAAQTLNPDSQNALIILSDGAANTTKMTATNGRNADHDGRLSVAG